MLIKLNRGEAFGRVKGGLICMIGQPLVWKGGQYQLNTEDFDEVFQDELSKIGYNVISTSGQLFDTGDANKAEFLVGGTIKSMNVDVCFPNSGFGDLMSAKGAATMEVEWQIFDRLNRTIVDTYTTNTGYQQKKTLGGGIETIVFSAFAENVRALAASGKLEKQLTGRPTNLSVAKSPDKVAKLDIALPKIGAGSISDAVGATVLVMSGDGHGTAFLISESGYFLTNQHVVGAAKYVKLRWSDGVESLGEVIKHDRGRDVAIIKAEARGRKPIAVRLEQVPVGTEVYAIGTPLDRALQSTVTRGIVSAQRVLDGYSFIQSDASVVPGSSGGPLIDKSGKLVAVTVAGVRINDAPQGINFFVPASEALQFLGVELPAE
jgi:serine protease Do